MALEEEALFLRKAVRAKLLDVDKGTAALYVFSQLKQMGAQFSFGDFLVERGLLTSHALAALHNASASAQNLQLVSTVGDYELLEGLGEGNNGTVYKARQRSMDRIVALKILNANLANDPQALARFQAEARSTAQFNHPNIVQGIDVGCDQGLYYFAMEFMDGGSARNLIDAAGGGGLQENLALSIVRQIAEGLKAAHIAEIMHRDVKPDNILLTLEGAAKLADLGISQRATTQHFQTDTGDFWASPPYVAPEVIQGESCPASDIYSLGCTLYELLAGAPPYVANTPEEVMQMHIYSAIPEIRNVRMDVSSNSGMLIGKMMQKDPAQRPIAAWVTAAAAKIMLVNDGLIDPGARRPQVAPLPAQRAVHPSRQTTDRRRGARRTGQGGRAASGGPKERRGQARRNPRGR